MLANTITDAATEPAANTDNTDMGVLPCPHFEGVEKRIEIDFHDGVDQRGTSPTVRIARQTAFPRQTFGKP